MAHSVLVVHSGVQQAPRGCMNLVHISKIEIINMHYNVLFVEYFTQEIK